MSHSACAAGVDDLATDVRESNGKHIELKPFSGSGSYTVVRLTAESDSDRLLSFSDDPGFDVETLQHREDCHILSTIAA